MQQLPVRGEWDAEVEVEAGVEGDEARAADRAAAVWAGAGGKEKVWHVTSQKEAAKETDTPNAG